MERRFGLKLNELRDFRLRFDEFAEVFFLDFFLATYYLKLILVSGRSD